MRTSNLFNILKGNAIRVFVFSLIILGIHFAVMNM